MYQTYILPSTNIYFEKSEKWLLLKPVSSHKNRFSIYKKLCGNFLHIVSLLTSLKLVFLAVSESWFSQGVKHSIARIFASAWHGVPEEIETKAGGTQNSPIDGVASRINKKLVQKSIFLHQNLADRNFSIKDRVLTNLFIRSNLKSKACGGRISPEVWQGGI